MKRPLLSLVAAIVAASLVVTGCTQSAPAPAPTQAPAAPAKAAAPTVAPAPTKAAAPTAAPAAAAKPTAAPAKVDWPQKGKSITYITPWPAGGSVDTQARVLAPTLEKELGVPVQVVNRAGASSQIGLAELAQSKPDGHTMAIITMPTGPSTYLDPDRKASYGRKDFEPVVLQVLDPEVIAVRAESPYMTLKDLVDAAKANPEKLTIGNTGIMSDNHLALLLFQKIAGVRFNIVPFEGYAKALPQMLGGHIDGIAATAGNFTPVFKASQARLLGIMDKQESKFFPGVKTFRSQGYDIDFASSRGIVVRGGTPKPIVDTLATAIKKSMDDPAVVSKYDDMGLPQLYMDTAEFTKYWDTFETQTKELLEMAKAEIKK